MEHGLTAQGGSRETNGEAPVVRSRGRWWLGSGHLSERWTGTKAREPGEGRRGGALST